MQCLTDAVTVGQSSVHPRLTHTCLGCQSFWLVERHCISFQTVATMNDIVAFVDVESKIGVMVAISLVSLFGAFLRTLPDETLFAQRL
jgi:hypothetical protein